MKRDLDLLRTILLKIEESNEPLLLSDMVRSLGNGSLIRFHVELLIDANYIDVRKVPVLGVRDPDFYIYRLTNDGCDYLDAVRNDTVWSICKDKLLSVGGTATLEVTKAVAVAVAKTMLGI